MERQNIMRVRVNRIALVQELKSDHIVRILSDVGVLTDDDRRRIDCGTTTPDKTRILIDLLPHKPKSVDWYKHFREALLNPDAGVETKKRYRSLVEFLDNTVIHRPESQASRFAPGRDKHKFKLPHYHPLPTIGRKEDQSHAQNILSLEGDDRKSEHYSEQEKGAKQDNIPEHEPKLTPWSHDNLESMTLVKGYFQQWIATPDNYRSLIEAPEEHFSQLQNSSAQEDTEQLEQEKMVLTRMRKLELVSVLARRKQLPDGFELCMCDIVHEILFDPNSYHLYFKYLKALEASKVDLVMDITNSFISIISNLEAGRSMETTKQVVKLGFHLIDFLADYGYYREAEIVMTNLMSFLSTTHAMEIWMAKYEGFVKLMHLRNQNYDFSKANQAWNFATEMTWQIKMMSFGKDLVNKGELHAELSHMMLELGQVNTAYGWAQTALKEISPENHASVVNCLCNAMMVYCAKWQVKRAELLAIQTVRYAREEFGMRHPLYLKALLHFCHFSSEFKQDEAGLEVAKLALHTAQMIYGCETIQVALAHRAVSKALLVIQKFDDSLYYKHVTEALRIARYLLLDDHPMLYLFLHTSASALQWQALHSSKDMQEATLRLAEVEAKTALDIVSTHYGEISLRNAQIFSLLGQIYSKMDNMQEAESHLQLSVVYMRLCQPANSNFLLLAKATLGTFFRIINKPKEAISTLKEVIHDVESVGVYLKWVHVCFDHLISTLQSLGSNKEADEMQICLAQWLRDNAKYNRVVTLDELHEHPKSFSQFMQDFNIWEKRSKKVLNFAKEKVAQNKELKEAE